MEEDSHSRLPLERCKSRQNTVERSRNKTGGLVVRACLSAQFLKKNANL